MYTSYQLLWFFLIYSCIGWGIDVIANAVRKKKFVNTGFLLAPICPIYGFMALGCSIFLTELNNHLFFLFLGGSVIGAFCYVLTGVLLEKMFHRKWWDCSKSRFHFEGYISIWHLLVFGGVTVLILRVMNSRIAHLVDFIPVSVGERILLAVYILLAMDLVLSLVVRRLKIKIRHWEAAGVFAQGCCFSKLFWLFIIGAFLGDVTETIFCRLTAGVWMSRSSVVYGPFSIVWGLGCAIFTAFLYKYKDSSDRRIFLAGLVLGGAYEYICSVFTELVFGTVFWDYSQFPFNLGGRINLLYCFFWGIAAVVWLKMIYPKLSAMIEKIPIKLGTVLTWLCMVLMVCNVGMSCLALERYSERQRGVEASGTDSFLDELFPDERMERIYPNAKQVE